MAYSISFQIPASNLIGQEGEGFKVAMNILNNGRFGIPAAMTGAMKFCIQKTVSYGFFSLFNNPELSLSHFEVLFHL